MSFSQENGYTPATIEAIIDSIMAEINTQFGTTYTTETFLGTNWYKFSYAIAQRIQANEVKTSEVFAYLQQYFAITNERISRPVGTTPGIIDALESSGYTASVKPQAGADAGKAFICVDVDDTDPDYATTKAAIAEIIKDSISAGVETQGTEVQSIVLSNGQSFDFKYDLPNRIEVDLRLTVTLSDNNQVIILSPEEQKNILMANIAARYRLGRDFEPQKYFSTQDAPWASKVLLEWSDDSGLNWYSTIYDADYDDLFDYALDRLTLVED